MAYPGLSDIRAAADEYWDLWQQLLAEAPELHQVIGPHSADALGWKVAGVLAPLEAALAVYELGDHVYCGPVNRERSIMSVRKSRPVALDSLQHVKFLQRRPSRPTDALGPDSLDFNVSRGLPKLEALKGALGDVAATVEADKNEAHTWISLTYKDYEFKLGDRSLWSICVQEAAALLEQ